MSRRKNGRRKSSDYRYWEMACRQRPRPRAALHYQPSDLSYALVGPVSNKDSTFKGGGGVWVGRIGELQ